MSLGIRRTSLCGYHMAKYFGGGVHAARHPLWIDTSGRIRQRLQMHTAHVLARRYTSSGMCTVHNLSSRGLLKVEGKDASDFLQGLITNTMKFVEIPRSSIYSMMLNAQGRVMYDLIVYNISNNLDEPYFLLECDSSATDSIVKDIKKYKLRKKVAIANVTDSYCLTAVLPPDPPVALELSVPDSDCHLFTSDPRVKEFGWRLITPADNPTDVTSRLGESAPEEEYHIQRYRWGISEGRTDLPPANCFPLESNLVYLNGACFQKGCYIGQELTARTYHTGVTRKRLMPLQFERPPENVAPGTDIRTEDDKLAGKYRHSIGCRGLGLMRLAESGKSLVMKAEGGEVYRLTASRPQWWPDDRVENQALG